jgi:hypothetical protein
VTIDESPLVEGLLWVGTDDGNVQVSRDGGTSWTNVSGNFAGVSEGTYVSRVEASNAVAGRAYVSFDAHRDGDFRPYVFVTEDYGQSWTKITAGLPDEGSVNVIKEHPDNPGLLFVGTEHALFVTVDRGRGWMQLKNNFPTTPVDDLVIHPRDNDLVIGTHGRSIWILEDLAPLSEFSGEVAQSRAHMFSIRSPMQFQKWKATSYRGQGEYAAPQPLDGAVINYWIGEGVSGPVQIEVVSADGRVVRNLQGSGGVGLHRVVWDLRMDPAASGGSGRGGGGGRGGGRGGQGGFQPPRDPNMTPWLQETLGSKAPFVLPTTYTVKLTAGGQTLTRPVVVRPDPMDRLTASEHQARWAFLVEADDLGRMIVGESQAIRDLLARVTIAKNAADQSRHSDMIQALTALETDLGEAQQVLNSGVRRNASGLLSGHSSAAARQGSLAGPRPDELDRLAQARAEAAVVTNTLANIRAERVPALDRRLRAAGLPTLGGGEQ